VSNQVGAARTVMRAAPSAHLRFGLICGFIILMWVFVLSRFPHDRLAWFAAAVAVAICATTMAWVVRFRLEYGGDAVTYRTLFGGDVDIDVRMIASAEVVTGARSYRDRFRPRVRLELMGKPGAPFRLVPVNIRIFRGDEFKQFTTFLAQRMRP